MGAYRKQRNYGCRVHDQYAYMGMRVVVLENELVRVSVLADKGTDIFEFLYKPMDLDFMWLSENGVQNPSAYLPTSPDPQSAFLDYYPGGWQEIFPNGGPTAVYRGAQFGQHGEVAHMPWQYEIVEDRPEHVSVRFSVRTKKMPCLLEKTLSLKANSPALHIGERLVNESDVPLRYMWGQHIAFGPPFLDESCVILLPDKVRVLTEAEESPVAAPGRVKRGRVYEWPGAEGADGNPVDLSRVPARGTASDIVYITGFGERAWYRVENRRLGAGFETVWDGKAFPYLWYWQEFGATADYPWFGRHYNIGLEPFTSFPTHGLEEAIANGSAAEIGPREEKTFRLSASPYRL